MLCPMCSSTLTPRELGSVHVDVCDGGCGGVWLDGRELRLLDEAHEGDAASLMDIPRTAHHERRPGRPLCPRCTQKYPLRTRRFHPIVHVDIEECPGCGGHWLDFGELHRIRAEAPDDATREAKARKVFDEMYATDLSARRQEHQTQLERMRRWLFRAPTA